MPIPFSKAGTSKIVERERENRISRRQRENKRNSPALRPSHFCRHSTTGHRYPPLPLSPLRCLAGLDEPPASEGRAIASGQDIQKTQFIWQIFTIAEPAQSHRYLYRRLLRGPLMRLSDSHLGLEEHLLAVGRRLPLCLCFPATILRVHSNRIACSLGFKGPFAFLRFGVRGGYS